MERGGGSCGTDGVQSDGTIKGRDLTMTRSYRDGSERERRLKQCTQVKKEVTREGKSSHSEC